MIILYEQEIAELKTEKEELKKEVTLLKRKLSYYKQIAYFEDADMEV
jgi:cell division protein FtsB